MKQRLLGDAVRYTLANLVSRGAQLVALLLLPYFLSPSEYGVIGLVAAVAAFVAIVAPLEVTQGLARHFATASNEEKLVLAATAWWFTLAMLCTLGVIGVVFANTISLNLFAGEITPATVRVAIGFVVVNTLIYFLQSQCRWEFRVTEYAIVSISYFVGTSVLAIFLAATSDDALMGALIGQALGGAVVVAASAWGLRNSLSGTYSGKALSKMLNFGLPLVPASIALILSTYAARLILNDYGGLFHVGLYTYASQIALVPTFAIIGIQAALTPLVMAHHAEHGTPATIARLFEGFVAVAGLICATFGVMARPVLQIIADPAYVDAAPLVAILAPALLMLQIYIFSPGFAIAKRTRLQMIVTIISAGIGLTLTLLLTAGFGIFGAAWAALGGGLVFASLWFMVSGRFYPIPFRWGRIAGFVFLWALVIALDIIVVGRFSSVGAGLLTKIGLLVALLISIPALKLISLTDSWIFRLK